MSYSEKDGQVIPELPVGCGYQGYEFGASYPDSICCGGKLYDADNCDNAGNLYDPGEDVPCPMCRHEDAVKYWYERNRLSGAKVRDAMKAAVFLVDDIRRNRKNGTEPWKTRTA
jgi:hypothetical protein